MRKQSKVVLWPLYFDSTKSRTRGRRVPKSLAISTPTLNEIQKALQNIALSFEVVLDVKHPSEPWHKTGMIMMSKKNTKAQIIQKIAKELVKNRAQTST